MQRELTSWKVGEWLDGARGLSHVRAAGVVATTASGVVAVAVAPDAAALLPPPNSAFAETGKKSIATRCMSNALTGNLGGSQPCGSSGMCSISTSMMAAGVTHLTGGGGMTAAITSDSGRTELEVLRLQVEQLKAQLASFQSSNVTPVPGGRTSAPQRISSAVRDQLPPPIERKPSRADSRPLEARAAYGSMPGTLSGRSAAFLSPQLGPDTAPDLQVRVHVCTEMFCVPPVSKASSEL